MASMASPVPPSALKRANQKTPRAGKNVVFADDKTRTNASPVPSRGQLLMRSDQAVYLLGSTGGE